MEGIASGDSLAVASSLAITGGFPLAASLLIASNSGLIVG